MFTDTYKIFVAFTVFQTVNNSSLFFFFPKQLDSLTRICLVLNFYDDMSKKQKIVSDLRVQCF